jgi:hypothetical protein
VKQTRKKAAKLAPVRARKEPPPAPVPSPSPRWPVRLLTAGAVLLILHGAVELLPTLLIIFPAANQMPRFIFDELARNWQMTLGVSVVSGLLRVAAAVGILKNLHWGWMLGIILSVITFAMLTFYLPMGVMDAVLSGAVLIALLVGRYPQARISG